MDQEAKNETFEKVGLVWFRTGLRLQDNAALFAALNQNEKVHCLYVLDDHYLRNADIGAARLAFLFDSLEALSKQIGSHGGQLILRLSSNIPEEVIRVAKEVTASRIYINEDYLPYPILRDRQTAALAKEQGLDLKTYRDILLVHPARVLTEEGRPYSVFTPFKRRWESLLSTPERYPIESALHKLSVSIPIPSSPIPSPSDYALPLKQRIEPGGEARAYRRLEEFVRLGLGQYHQRRDIASDPNSTSRLSMHLKWGTVSVRDCYREARNLGGAGAEKWIDELAWREFYHAIMFHFPHSLTGPMLPEYADFPWDENDDYLESWKAGMTGYPFVDAGMRQLNETGWMHNRLRQVVASYLCKNLLINWQEGEKYFMQMLTDGDWPANNGGWQWVAGSGTDPRRATRIFNPVLQMERYDPNAEYVRQWVPEYGTSRYPAPLVTHEVGRQNYLERFGSTSAGRMALREARKEEMERNRPPKAARRSKIRNESQQELL